MYNDDLDNLRNSINTIDDDLVDLLSKRIDTVKKIAKIKYDNNLDVINNSRENEIIERIKNSINNKETGNDIESLMKYIMNQSKAKQLSFIQKLINNDDEKNIISKNDKNVDFMLKNDGSIVVGFQGVKGSYSHEALDLYFNSDVKAVNFNKFSEVFESVVKNEVDFGVIPIENSSTGNINEVYDLIKKYPISIVGEKIIEINHCIIGMKNASIENINELYSHPQAFLQTSEYLDKFNHIKQVPYFNTAISVKKVKELSRSNIAAIGSKKSAKIYNLEILKQDINNAKNNFTKFIIISCSDNLVSNDKHKKISLLFSVDHTSGSLYKVLENFAINGVNLLKLESRPIREKPWEYMFYVDIEGTLNDITIKTTIDNVRSKCIDFRVLGEYASDNTFKNL